MTVVIADTSPLNYLALIGEVEILRALYNKVVVPPEVLVELLDSDAPLPVRDWVRSRPAWFEVRAVRTACIPLSLQHLDAGERAAILLAQEESESPVADRRCGGTGRG